MWGAGPEEASTTLFWGRLEGSGAPPSRGWLGFVCCAGRWGWRLSPDRLPEAYHIPRAHSPEARKHSPTDIFFPPLHMFFVKGLSRKNSP